MLFSPAFVAAALAAAPATAAGPEVVFPLDLASSDVPSLDALRYVADVRRVAQLARLDEVTLTAVMLPDGRMVDLELARIRTERLKFAYNVDGIARTDLLDGTDLSIWKGRVRGAGASEAMLSFSQVGTQGWIRLDDALVHVLPRPGEGGDWWHGDVLLVDERELERRGMRLESECLVEAAEREQAALPQTNWSSNAPSAPLSGPECVSHECKISLTSDFQYFQKFNDLAAQTTYTTTLWSFISDRYETQADTILTFPSVAFYTTVNDPWLSSNSPAPTGTSTCGDVLDELRNAWDNGNIPAGGDIGHLMSGQILGCGVAYLDVLCNPNFAFSVSGNLNGTISFPIVQQPNNWDFIVCAHEVGHNFDAQHTHDYCPPLDECPPSQYFGACQSQQVCSNQGTIMSYCHLCAGGTANITTFFHPVSSQFMTQAAQNCLGFYADVTGSAPTLLATGVATPVTANVFGTPVGPVKLWWRANPSLPFVSIDMTSQGGGNWSATLPAFGCAETPQFYYAFDMPSGCTATFPGGAPANVLTAAVGVPQAVFQDDFQTDQGWTASNLGASSGDWQRGVPVNDPGWNYAPSSDGDGSGSCWLTQNALGNTDVDNGAVRLQSPQLDLSNGPVMVEYLYYLRLTDSDGSDALVVEISANGTAGPWVEVARHDDDRGNAWTAHSIAGSDITAAGVTLGSNMRLRFTANDGGAQSIVESGLDGFRTSRVVCNGIGVNYCTSLSNSTGNAAVMSASGSKSIAANDLILHAGPVPAGVNGIFFFGSAAAQVPFANGIRCVAPPTVRLGIQAASGNQLDRAIDNTLPPAASYFATGSTWNFQAWFRDPAAGGANANLSDGYRITFVP